MTQLLENAWMGTVLILVTAALRRLLRDRLPAGTWLALWGVCLFRLLTPVSPDSIFSLYGLPRLLAGAEQASTPISADAAQFILSAEAVEQPLLQLETAGQTAMGSSTGFAAPSSSTVLWWLYLLTAVALALYFVQVWFSTRRAVGWTIPLGQDDPRYADLPRYARLREGPMEGAPLTFGVVRPTVVLAPGLSGAELDYVLAHETVHVQRRDNLWNYAMAAALAVHWWNPAVWLMARLLRRDVELSCDRAVLARLGGGHKAAYAQTLVSLAVQGEGPAFSRPFGQKQAEERIIAIMKYKKTTIVGLALALVLVCGVTAAFAASAPNADGEAENVLAASGQAPSSTSIEDQKTDSAEPADASGEAATSTSTGQGIDAVVSSSSDDSGEDLEALVARLRDLIEKPMSDGVLTKAEKSALWEQLGIDDTYGIAASSTTGTNGQTYIFCGISH